MSEKTTKKEWWYPVRWGVYCRRALLKVSSSYGSGWFFRVKRPLAVFISTLLDENHQEIENPGRSPYDTL